MRRTSRIGIVALVCCVAIGAASAKAPLHEAAAEGKLEELDRLIAAGEDVNMLKWKAWSPLYYAAKKGRIDVVTHLVEVHDARIDHAHGVTSTPLYIATQNGHREIAEYLVRRGADYATDVYYGKGKKRQAFSAQRARPNWPWGRWSADRRAALDRVDDALQAERAEARALEEAAAEAERLAKLRTRWERDSRLPIDVRKDKYLLALRKNLDEGDHESALIYCDFLRKLDVPLGPTFDLYHGQILLQSGQTDEALDRLYAFVQNVDAGDSNYTRALELINDAEGR